MIPMVGANVWTCFAKAEWRPDGAAQGTGFEVLSANIAQSAQCDARRAGGCDRRWQPRHIVGDGCPRAVPQGRVAGGIEAARAAQDIAGQNRPDRSAEGTEQAILCPHTRYGPPGAVGSREETGRAAWRERMCQSV